MSRRLLLLAVLLAGSGCAAPRAQKLSFEEAFGRPAQKPSTVVRDERELAASAAAPAVLRLELARFTTSARDARVNATTGGAMTPEQQENWARLLDAVDGFLSYPAEETALEDVARAHAVSEVELERDSQLFGEIPPQLAERVLDRVSRLSERLVEVRRLHPPPRPEEEERRGFAWPIDPVIVTSLFGERLHPIHRTWRTHAGLDLRAYPGQQVSAAASGTVVHAGWNGAHGIQVQLEHEDGLTTRYSHLSAALVEEGAKVERGDPVGLAGRSGTATGVHLHFEVWRDGKALDPLETLADAEPAPANEKGAASSRRRPSSAER